MSLGALTRDPRPGAGGPSIASAGNGAMQQAIDALAKFIPTEMLAPFVAGLSLASMQNWNPAVVYWSFLIATPFVFLLFRYAQSARDENRWPSFWITIWRGVAATFAFGVWGLSVPDNPYQTVIGGAAVAGFVALIVSPVLSAADAIVVKVIAARPKKPDD